MNLSTLLHIKPGKSITYWMIEKVSKPYIQVLSFIAFSIIFYCLFGGIGGALAMMLGIYLHELGHYYVLNRNGIKSTILFIFPLGALAAPINEEEDKRSDQLPMWILSQLLLAGIVANVILMGLGTVMILIGFWPVFGHQLIFGNGLLAIINLIPFWKTDGSQLFNVIFASFNAKKTNDRVSIVWLLSIVVIVFTLISSLNFVSTGFMFTLFENRMVILMFLISAIGIAIKHICNKPKPSFSSKVMTFDQALVISMIFVLMMTSSLILLNLPF